MMNARKMFALFCVLALVVGMLAACSGNNKAANSSKGNTAVDTKGDNTAVEVPAETPAEPFKLTIMANLHTPEVPTDKIEKLIEGITNTDLTIQWVPDGNYEEKLS